MKLTKPQKYLISMLLTDFLQDKNDLSECITKPGVELLATLEDKIARDLIPELDSTPDKERIKRIADEAFVRILKFRESKK